MNRRGFFARASALAAGVLASCGMHPALVFAQEKEPRILDILRDEVKRARKTAPKDLAIEEPSAGEPYPFRFHVLLWRSGHLFNITLVVDPLATADEIRKQFRREYAKAMAKLYAEDFAGQDDVVLIPEFHWRPGAGVGVSNAIAEITGPGLGGIRFR